MATQPATELGRKVFPHNFSVTLPAALTVKIPSGRNRTALIIGNTTASVIYVNFNSEPGIRGGIPIAGNSGRLELVGPFFGTAMESEIWVRGGFAGDVIECVEFIEGP